MTVNKNKRQKRNLPPAAQRAVNEAIKRNSNKKEIELPKEFGGRKGLEPTRFGDWEKKGIISDF